MADRAKDSRREFLDYIETRCADLAKRCLNIGDETAGAFALELAQAIATDYGGHQPYIAKDVLKRAAALHQAMWQDYSGNNISELADKYKVSKIWAYAVVKRMRAQDQAARQSRLDLPAP